MKKVAVVGDVILDKYIIGDTHRISPEAPVPIVAVASEKYTLGGAANVAHNLVNLEVDVDLFGVIGDDRHGGILQELCNAKNIKQQLYISDNNPTTCKTRVISRNQQMLRIDHEEIFVHSPKSLAFHSSFFADYPVIVISDYNKGYCADELLEMVFTNRSSEAKIIIDPKGHQWEKYNGAFMVKPNLLELEVIIGHHIDNTDEAVAQYGKKVFDQYNFQYLVITRGSKGMTMIGKDGIEHFKTRSVEVFDVSGAGDTAMAVIAYSTAQGLSMGQAIHFANLASSYVVTKPLTYAIQRHEYDDLLKENI